MPTKTRATRPTTVTHKKRRGDHHRLSKHYLKVYWPYVPMLLIVMVGLFFGTPRESTRPGVLAYATEMSSSQLLSSTNTQRGSNGKGALSINAALTNAAQTKANDMAARNYWSHNTPEGNPPWYFIENAGYSYIKAGENLAYGFGTSADTITGWMNSPTHRDNLLDASYTEVGFGYVDSANYNNSGQETIVVAMYGQPQVAGVSQAAPTPTPAPSAPAAPAPTPTPAPSVPAAVETETAASGGTANPAAEEAKPVTTETATVTEPATQSVTKLQALSGGRLPWLTFAVGIFSGGALLFVALKHSLAFKRVLVHGEQFMLHHPLLDIGLVGLVMIGYALSQTTGFIK